MLHAKFLASRIKLYRTIAVDVDITKIAIFYLGILEG